MPLVPVSSHVWRVLQGGQVLGTLVGAARQAARVARAFHWPLEFPHILLNQNETRRGFDVVLGNPPWEVMQLNEEEYFSQLLPEVAELPGAARKRAIAALEAELPALFSGYIAEKRRFEGGNEFARESGRFALSARGKINTYSLFAELIDGLTNSLGRAGVIVPTGVGTDSSSSGLFGEIVDKHKLVYLLDFENRDGIFPAVHRSFKFCLLTLGRNVAEASFAFFLTDPVQLSDPERRFTLSSSQIATINPNTRTAPVFRTRCDAELVSKIHAAVPVLARDGGDEYGRWSIAVATRLWNMTEDAAWFKTAMQLKSEGFERNGSDWIRASHSDSSTTESQNEHYVKLYEAKLIHQFDHRWATYEGELSRDVTTFEKTDPDFEPIPRYWVPKSEVEARLASMGWNANWVLGWRKITNSTNERTSIFAAMPRLAVGHSAGLLFINASPNLAAALFGNLNALVLDFVARVKVGGTNLTFGHLEQFPIIPPSAYSESDLAVIVPRVLELSYSSQSMAPFARGLNFDGSPFKWDENRRALLRAELDAWYVRAYGLTRDELRYILNPAEIQGDAYPSETFRGLKNSEIVRFGEYRTQRLVLAAWDRQAAGLPPESELDREPIALTPTHEVSS